MPGLSVENVPFAPVKCVIASCFLRSSSHLAKLLNHRLFSFKNSRTGKSKNRLPLQFIISEIKHFRIA